MIHGAAAAFTRKGAALCDRLCAALPGSWRGYAPSRYCTGSLREIRGGVGEWAAGQFSRVDALLFVGAAGIAVRAVAPLLRGKDRDPAVVCVDQEGRFVIPLLSGHMGGANKLARQIADLCGGEAVITTATDRDGVFAVDAWAVERGYAIPHPHMIKAVSGALLDSGEVGMCSRFPVEGELPPGIRRGGDCGTGICISLAPEAPFPNTLWLVPRCLWLGVGCRKDTGYRELERHVLETLESRSLSPHGLAGVATIDRKAEEPAILELCRRYRLPLRIYDVRSLQAARGEFQPSAFVQSVTGVDNVCERAASLAGDRMMIPKTSRSGVSIAVSAINWRVTFATAYGGN